MLCIVIKGPSLREVYQQLSKAYEYADLVELRLDSFQSCDLHSLKILRSSFSIPMIFTLRSQLQGGNFTQSEEKRLAEIQQLLTLKPEYLDLEYHVEAYFIRELISQYPETKLILSYHNFIETPYDINKVYQEMRKIPAFFYKIAVTARNCLDALRVMCWAKKFEQPIILISMGLHGQISRILAPMMRCPITYAVLEEDPASTSGQLSAKTLIERYQYRTLNPYTALYGLIGNPVDQSVSDETHNRLIAKCGLDAVYVKFQVSPSEIPDFFFYIKQLPVHGLSVTMPLKECIIPYLDHLESKARDSGAVNTLFFEKGRIFGFNTDGIGALNAIEKHHPVKDQRALIIGTGGAAKAIAAEAQLRGCMVTMLGRNSEKTQETARRLHCVGTGLEHMAICAKAGYEILINCTPASLPIDAESILHQSIVMDIITKPKETLFLKLAIKKDCRVIYGYEMFIEQALEQFKIWFTDECDIQENHKHFEKFVIDSLTLRTGKEQGTALLRKKEI